MNRRSTILLFTLGLSASAMADIYLWSGNAANVAINFDDAEILAAGTYRFEALTSPGGSVLADIGLISINPSVTGIVNVHIERSTGGAAAPGAVNVAEIRLDAIGATYTGNLAELRITGELGTVGPTVARNITGDVVFNTTARDITASVNISGRVALSNSENRAGATVL